MNAYTTMLAGLFVVHALALASPGPNVLIVMRAALGDSRRSGVLTALGVASGAAMWSIAALFGLSLELVRTPMLAAALRAVGGLYLVHLGWRLWRGAGDDAFARLADVDLPARLGDARAYRQGVLTNLTNPKALVFFVGIFGALLPPAAPLWVKLCAIAIVVVNATAWHVALACFFSTRRARHVYARVKPWVDRIAGAALAVLGLRLFLPEGGFDRG